VSTWETWEYEPRLNAHLALHDALEVVERRVRRHRDPLPAHPGLDHLRRLARFGRLDHRVVLERALELAVGVDHRRRLLVDPQHLEPRLLHRVIRRDAEDCRGHELRRGLLRGQLLEHLLQPLREVRIRVRVSGRVSWSSGVRVSWSSRVRVRVRVRVSCSSRVRVRVRVRVSCSSTCAR